MGWTSCSSHITKKQLTSELLAYYQKSEQYTVLGSASTVGAFYIAVRMDAFPKGIILVYLVEKHRGEWASKGMDETAGPNISNCPLSLLEMTEGDGSRWSKDWREKVRAFHAAKSRTFPLGSRVSVYGAVYKVISVVSRKSYKIESEENGQIFRCTAIKMEPLESENSNRP